MTNATLAPSGVQLALRVDAVDVTRHHRNGVTALTKVTLTIAPGEMVAVIGASGAGKTTLLETLAGLRHASSGSVRFDGHDVQEHRDAFRTAVGYVPQDDIIHRDLPVRATIRHAARLRLPELTASELDQVVERTIDVLALTAAADTIVAKLSGGQRKRVSIAVELLTAPRALFLDEPTSGLDPGTARSLLATLHTLAGDGSTVVMTTHSPDDVRHCDRVVVLATGGRLVYDGPPAGAPRHFGVDDVADIYRALDQGTFNVPAAETAPALAAERTPPVAPAPAAPSRFRHQWAVLCRRNLQVLVHNRLTLAIMLAAPVLVVAMFVLLFRHGAFDAASAQSDPLAAVGITYWLAFAAFFFGLTYGLLQVVTEFAVVRREHHVGLGLGAYLLAKVTVLVPVLLVVNTAMVVALRATGRLPEASGQDYAMLLVVLLLDSIGALALGLLASAAVTDPSHATLALPMLCFPAVLFGGAVLPVGAMAFVGRAISVVTPDRWAFEGLGRVLDLGTRFAGGPGGDIVTQQHGDTFTGALTGHLVIQAAFVAAFLLLAARVLQRRTAVS